MTHLNRKGDYWGKCVKIAGSQKEAELYFESVSMGRAAIVSYLYGRWSANGWKI